MVKEQTLWVAFIRSDDNPEDIETKNSREPLYLKHSENVYEGTLRLDPSSREDVNMSIMSDEDVDDDVIRVSTPHAIAAVENVNTMVEVKSDRWYLTMIMERIH